MTKELIRIMLTASVASFALCSCGGGSKEPSPLISQSERVALDLATLADDSPMFIDSTCVDYSDGFFGVSVAFCDSAVHVSDYSDALVQYVLAQYMKNHTGPDLDVIINTLTKEEGKFAISLSDSHGYVRGYEISAGRLKQLVKLKPMELAYNDVRTNVSDIMDKECASYKAQYNASEAEFSISGGFAQYTLTFERPTAYASLNQASLTGRYLKILQPRYEEYGACRPMVEELLRSLSIDGYRFIYTDKNETKTISAGIPWRLIDK